jgi:hypothetical protein
MKIGEFAGSFLLLISGLMPLWSENIVHVISVHLVSKKICYGVWDIENAHCHDMKSVVNVN